MKKLIALLLICCMILPVLPITASAAKIVKSGTCGENLIWTLDAEGLLTVSGYGPMDDFWVGDNIYGPWPGIRTQVRTVVVEDGVTTIGSAAFYDFHNCTSVSLPDGIDTVGDYAFAYCEALTEVILPDGVTSIGAEGFFNCFSIVRLEVPDSVRHIGDRAFMGCQGLTALHIPAGLTRIGSHVYACCSALTSAVIPEGVTEIGDYAFWGCEKLSCVTIPEGVTYIGPNAFRACVSLTEVEIPDSVKTIGDEAFAICEGLISIDLGSGVESIGYHAFYDCVSLKSLTIPQSVTSIGDDIYEACLALEEIRFLGDAPEIGPGTFQAYTNAIFYYPPDNSTWTEEVLQNFNESLRVQPSCLEHAYQTVITDPTCEEQGCTTHTCTVCGDSYVDSYVDALGHRSGETVVENKADVTCMIDGCYDNVVYCERCDAELSRETIVIPATGHSYESMVTVPTCEEQGYTTYTCTNCSDSYVDSYVDALGHQPGETVVENKKDATCITDGSYDNVVYCERCDAELSREIVVIPTAGHNYEVVDTTPPTCEEYGHTTYTCSECGDSYSANSANPVDHVYEDGECIWCGEEESDEPEKPEVLLGDVDGNGVINTFDALMTLKYYTGEVTGENVKLDAADVDGNGIINTFDALLILKYYTGEITRFPAETEVPHGHSGSVAVPDSHLRR